MAIKQIENANREVDKIAMRYLRADVNTARQLKRVLSGKAGGAKTKARVAKSHEVRQVHTEISRIYSRAARRLKTPR